MNVSRRVGCIVVGVPHVGSPSVGHPVVSGEGRWVSPGGPPGTGVVGPVHPTVDAEGRWVSDARNPEARNLDEGLGFAAPSGGSYFGAPGDLWGNVVDWWFSHSVVDLIPGVSDVEDLPSGGGLMIGPQEMAKTVDFLKNALLPLMAGDIGLAGVGGLGPFDPLPLPLGKVIGEGVKGAKAGVRAVRGAVRGGDEAVEAAARVARETGEPDWLTNPVAHDPAPPGSIHRQLSGEIGEVKVVRDESGEIMLEVDDAEAFEDALKSWDEANPISPFQAEGTFIGERLEKRVEYWGRPGVVGWSRERSLKEILDDDFATFEGLDTHLDGFSPSPNGTFPTPELREAMAEIGKHLRARDLDGALAAADEFSGAFDDYVRMGWPDAFDEMRQGLLSEAGFDDLLLPMFHKAFPGLFG